MKKIPLILSALFLAASVHGQTMTSQEIDQLAAKEMQGFQVPGMAVAIIKDGKVIHSKGYGVRSIRNNQPVDENTVFGIASNTKAFTAAAMGILVDEGKVRWEDKVRDYIPEFKMYDPYVTEAFTIRDLLSHHSGLADGEGDLMIIPDSSDFTVKDIIYNMRFLKPAYGFRTQFGYSNMLYAIAGEVIARVSGISYDDFIEQKIMQPLGMTRSAASFNRLKDTSNRIDAHEVIDGKIRIVTHNQLAAGHAVGGVAASLADLEKWVLLKLNGGKYGDKQLFSSNVQNELWSPQTLLPVYPWMGYNTTFAAAGMGIDIFNVMGNNRVIRANGELDGMLTTITMIPEQHLGFIILLNADQGPALTTMANQIKDRYLGITNSDRFAENLPRYKRAVIEEANFKAALEKKINAVLAKNGNAAGNVTGSYNDKWLGDVNITKVGNGLLFACKRSPKLTGCMYLYNGSTYVVKWNDVSMEADAFVLFNMDENGNATGFTMKAVSPQTDFSYDFPDLDFKRKQ